ncbi:ABC-2 type transport system permease protein [Flavobacterium arsenatis]|uniref:ABC-2 type transport system permease protein n=1 Tax=Flavobacterium arsenatis TaxID=1484332 RepID=A0ABU1TT08_9FLAO|nr:M1 family aminopeptidase [Flavobacterium arsenatis]MDR6968961.1 ABC-2 type transport system permease protein [Flavobacterium arsenatis]
MLGTIFSFEFKRWFKNISFYLYFAVFFIVAFFAMAFIVGYFDFFGATTASNTIFNSPIAINAILGELSQLVYFIIPTVIGATVYRDFKYNTHTILYSYPFNKFDYLVGKFLSGFFITIFITFSIGLGFLLATVLPFANESLLGPIDIWAYFQAYVIFVIPNIFFIGSIIFALVTLTRNVYIGFIFVILLFVFQALLENITNDMDNKYVAALVEPYGSEALNYVTKYWTIEEQNTKDIPFDAVIIYNRLIWIGVSLLVFIALYFSFSFTHSPLTLGRKKKAERITKNNFGSIIRINLPKVNYDYSFIQNLKTAWSISSFEFKLITKNWIFITIAAVLVLFVLISGFSLGQELYGTRTYPVTWKVVDNLGRTFNFFIRILIFLFSGYLLQLANNSRMGNLVDSTPIPNWTLLLSKFLALFRMTLVILFLGMIACMLVQVYYSYYNFEILHYIKELFGFRLIGHVVLIGFSLFIQSFFKNYLAGFFVILVLILALPAVSALGIEHPIFSFNSGMDYEYSDMNQYGSVRGFFIYKIYWLLFIAFLYGVTLLFFRRGILSGAKERLKIAGRRMRPAILIPTFVALIAFLGLGTAIYRHDTVDQPYYSSQELELQQVDFEKKYKKYENYPKPRIVDVKVDMAIFPQERDYNAKVKYVMVNKTDKNIDSLFISYGDNLKSITFEAKNKLVSKDTVLYFDIYKLEKSILPGDTLLVNFEVKNRPNTFLEDRSSVIENGTFLNNGMFPSFGYNEYAEIADNDIRKKYKLPAKERMAATDDAHARENTYISNEADWITFETTVSTSEDQIAIAPGYLQKEWKENGRRYFHYKMDQKMLNFYAFNSARYQVKKEKSNGVNLEIYYHEDHEYNLDRMMDAMKRSLEYYSENFSPYQHKQVRIIEFPRTMGTFAQSFANTIPFSEAIGFIAKVDEEDPNAVDYPFSVISHEVAHQWWAHQVIGANVKGATLMSESLSEYSSLKVLEHKYGKAQMRRFLKDALDGYLMGRTFEWKHENPLMYNENQQYIHYQKGSLVLYAMSEYLGEKNFNNILKGYVKEVAFQEAPYTNSIEFVNHIRKGTPEKYQYLIEDMFETITLYDNKVEKVTSKKLPNGKYQVDIKFTVSKYRSNDKGKKEFKDKNGKMLTYKGKPNLESYPLNDFIEVGIFGEKTKKGDFELENELYNKRYKIDQIANKLTIIVDEKPMEVGVDPYNKLIDTNSEDNRMKL